VQNFEYRHHHQLQVYWDKLRATRPFPRESEINPDDLEEIWGSCFLVGLLEEKNHLGYRYSYLGSELLEAYGEDPHNPDIVTKLVAPDTEPLIKRFEEVVRTGKPVVDEGEFTNIKRLNIRYRTCLLPLGNADDKVGFILGCMRWKAY
jgi:hypothetical protein